MLVKLMGHLGVFFVHGLKTFPDRATDSRNSSEALCFDAKVSFHKTIKPLSGFTWEN